MDCLDPRVKEDSLDNLEPMVCLEQMGGLARLDLLEDLVQLDPADSLDPLDLQDLLDNLVRTGVQEERVPPEGLAVMAYQDEMELMGGLGRRVCQVYKEPGACPVQ
jgi:hypothetical protein